MKKLFTTILLAGIAAFSVQAQTATDFTTTDCNSTSHNLFTQLNSGKVVVMVWVMPCPACEGPAKAAYNAVQSFAASHPGKVLYYLIDDYGDDPCSALSSWVTTENIGSLANMTLFGNANMVIKMSDYGTDGMPKVVVTGGSNHTVFYNKNNSSANDLAGITAAINAALVPTSLKDIRDQLQFTVAMKTSANELTINSGKTIRSISITSITGQVVMQEVFSGGSMNPSVKLNDMAEGVYVIQVTDMDNRTGVRKFVR